VAAQIHGELAGQDGLLPPHLEEVARRIAEAGAGVEVKVQTTPPTPRGGRFVEEFETAMFEIPEVGRVSPPVRTRFGWHVILLTELHPARTLTRDDVVPALFARARHERFRAWTDELVRGARVVTFEDALEEPAP
jgi:hypothetical protein